MALEKIRLDQRLVDLGHFESRTKAQAAIMAGLIVVDEHRVDKPGTKIKENAMIRVKGKGFPDVSRAGLKLRGALEQWPCTIKDQVCLDVGACTGGFTDVLLKAGALRVYALDVGHSQLHSRLVQDTRVVNMEKHHINRVSAEDFDPLASIVVSDVSFISLTKIIENVLCVCAQDSRLYLLIKPQFEAERHEIGKGGIVHDAVVRESIRDRCIESLGKSLNLVGVCESPIQGTKGNVEYISAWTRKS